MPEVIMRLTNMSSKKYPNKICCLKLCSQIEPIELGKEDTFKSVTPKKCNTFKECNTQKATNQKLFSNLNALYQCFKTKYHSVPGSMINKDMIFQVEMHKHFPW